MASQELAWKLLLLHGVEEKSEYDQKAEERWKKDALPASTPGGEADGGDGKTSNDEDLVEIQQGLGQVAAQVLSNAGIPQEVIVPAELARENLQVEDGALNADSQTNPSGSVNQAIIKLPGQKSPVHCWKIPKESWQMRV